MISSFSIVFVLFWIFQRVRATLAEDCQKNVDIQSKEMLVIDEFCVFLVPLLQCGESQTFSS